MKQRTSKKFKNFKKNHIAWLKSSSIAHRIPSSTAKSDGASSAHSIERITFTFCSTGKQFLYQNNGVFFTEGILVASCNNEKVQKTFFFLPGSFQPQKIRLDTSNTALCSRSCVGHFVLRRVVPLFCKATTELWWQGHQISGSLCPLHPMSDAVQGLCVNNLPSVI